MRLVSPVRELIPSAWQGQARRPPSYQASPPVFLEIGFLLDHGVPSETLARAVATGVLCGVTPSEALLRLGLVTEDIFYRALAAELGLRFEAKPRLSRAARFPESLLAGFAPSVFRGRFVAAPIGAQVARLLKDRARFGELAITTPGALRDSVFALQAQRIAAAAANRLPSMAPHLSVRDGIGGTQIAILSTLSALLGFAFGLFTEPVTALFFAGLAVLFLAMVALRCAAALAGAPPAGRNTARRTPDSRLPVYTIVVALHREAAIAGALVDSLGRLDYPAAKLDIKLVLEADDIETRSALTALDLPAHMEILVAPNGHPRTKPRALNMALPLARGLYTVVYDAEDVPDPDQLRLAVETFATAGPDVACLQAHLAIDNTDDCWLTRFFTLEYAALFDVINPGLARLRLPVPLGGTSNHFRTDTLRRIGGWDAWNVTEDADLGIRLARLGYRVEDLASTTHEEAPQTLPAWMRQRSRWMKGFVQTCVTHSRQPVAAFRELGPLRFAGALTMTFGTVLSAIGYPICTLLFVATLALDGTPVGATLASTVLFHASVALFTLGVAAMIVPAAMALRRRGLSHLWPLVPLLPLYYVLVSVAAWRALWELAGDPFRWNKTEHGRARTSRTRPTHAPSSGPTR